MKKYYYYALTYSFCALVTFPLLGAAPQYANLFNEDDTAALSQAYDQYLKAQEAQKSSKEALSILLSQKSKPYEGALLEAEENYSNAVRRTTKALENYSDLQVKLALAYDDAQKKN